MTAKPTPKLAKVARLALLPMLTLTLPARAWPAGSDVADTAGTAETWLEWSRADGAESCPEQAELVARMKALLGRSPAEVAAEAGRRLRLRVARESGRSTRWLGQATILDAQGQVIGERQVTRPADSCQPIVDALALVASLSLSKVATGVQETAPSPGPPSPAPVSPPNPQGSPPPESPRPAIPAGVLPAPKQTWALAVDGGLAVAAGLLPTTSPGLRARVLVAPPRWPALYAVFTLWQTRKVSLADGSGAELRLWTAGAGSCWTVRSGVVLAGGICAGLDTGRWRASGFGFSQVDATTTTSYLDFVVGPQVEAHLGRGVRAGLALQLAVPVIRARLAYRRGAQGSVELWRAWPVLPMGFAYVGYAFR